MTRSARECVFYDRWLLVSKKKLQIPGMRVLDRAAIEAEVERLRALAEYYASLVAAANQGGRGGKRGKKSD